MADANDPASSLKRLLGRLGVGSVEEAEQKLDEQEKKLDEQARVIVRLNGSAFCSLDDLYGVEFKVCSEKDFESLCRDWTELNILEEDVLKVYNLSREAAQVAENRVSTSPALTKLGNKKPVRLCSHEEIVNYAEKAHLCPKTGELGKADTWIYAAAAVLGMPSESREDREALLKALRGSVRQGQNNVMHLTGLNRSPFNLMSFLHKDVWFDEHPGVVALPCLSPAEARNWQGGSYSIIILCGNVQNIATADNVAVNIALPRTPHDHLQVATDLDISKSTWLLRRVLLASAFCLMNRNGPDTDAGNLLWKKYREQLVGSQTAAYAVSGDRVSFRSVMLPTIKEVAPFLPDKIVAKINLADMVPPVPGSPAYPDPLLLAYKSSVNWTRRYSFQMMAEAEPQGNDILGPYGPVPQHIFVDQGSKASVDGSSIPEVDEP